MATNRIIPNDYPRISFDVDGILADFYKAACARYNQPEIVVNKFLVDWINPVHDEIMADSAFWATLPTMIQHHEILCYIHCYITSIDAIHRKVRTNWLIENKYQNRPVFISYKKHEVCLDEKIDIHVDDRLGTIKDIMQYCPNTVAILHLPWYLRYEDIPVNIIVTRTTDELMQEIAKQVKIIQTRQLK